MSKYASALKKIQDSQQAQIGPAVPKWRPVYKVPGRSTGSDARKSFFLLVVGLVVVTAVYFFGLKRGLDLNKSSGPAGANAMSFVPVESEGLAKKTGASTIEEAQWMMDPSQPRQEAPSRPAGADPGEPGTAGQPVLTQGEGAGPQGVSGLQAELREAAKDLEKPINPPAAAKKEIPVITPDVPENFFTIQLAAYRQQDRARQEAERLAEKGYKAFLLRAGGMYQVCIENFKNASSAREKLAEIRTDGQIKVYQGAYVRPIKT